MSPRRTVGYVKLEWTCPNCSTRNPGPQKTCINCGAPQPENVQFERAAEEALVTDARAMRAAQAGADFMCPYCSSRNSADTKACVHCGGDLLEARRRSSGGELAPNAGPRAVACANCGTSNPASHTNCTKCGSPLQRSAPLSPAAASPANSLPASAA